MNPKNTFILVILAAGIFAFIFFVEPKLRKPKPAPLKVLPADFQPGAVTAVQIQLAHQLEIRVERTNGGWRLTKPLVYPALSAAVESLLQAAATLSPQTVISAQELKGRVGVNEEYGFDNPQATLVFLQDGEPRTLKLGYLTAPGDQLYAEMVSGDRVDIIDADFLRKFVPRQPDDWRDPIFVRLNGRDFDQVAVANGAQGFILQRATTNEPWHMEKPVRTRADYPKIDDLLLKLAHLRVARFETDNPSADLEAYGLQPPRLEIKLSSGSNAVLVAQFGKSPANDDSHVYARCNGQSTVVLIPSEPVLAWQTGFQDFRDSHLVRLRDGLPQVIEVVGPSEKFTVERQTNDAWRVTKPIEFPADTNVMNAFIDGLTGLQVVRFNNMMSDDAVPDSEFPRYGLDKPSRQYILKRSTPATASNMVTAQLDFGSEKDGKIFVRRADRPDETSVYAVNVADFQKLPAASLQLRERRIWNFSEADVTRLTIRQNGETQTLVHRGPNQWEIVKGAPGMQKNDLAVEVGAQELGLLEARNWVKRGDEDRAQYGFSDKSPRITVEVNANGKPQALMVDFGKLSPDGLRYGDVLMDDGQNWIFEFSQVVVDRLTAYFYIGENAFP